jgi:hypothetical protein
MQIYTKSKIQSTPSNISVFDAWSLCCNLDKRLELPRIKRLAGFPNLRSGTEQSYIEEIVSKTSARCWLISQSPSRHIGLCTSQEHAVLLNAIDIVRERRNSGSVDEIDEGLVVANVGDVKRLPADAAHTRGNASLEGVVGALQWCFGEIIAGWKCDLW